MLDRLTNVRERTGVSSVFREGGNEVRARARLPGIVEGCMRKGLMWMGLFAAMAGPLSAELSNVTVEMLAPGQIRVTFDPGTEVEKAWVEWGTDALTHSAPARRFVEGLTLYRASLEIGSLRNLQFRCLTESESTDAQPLPIYNLTAKADPLALLTRISWNWGISKYSMVRYSKGSMLDGTNRSIHQVGNESAMNAVDIPVSEQTHYYYQVFSSFGPLPPDAGGYLVGSPEFEFDTPALAQPMEDDRLGVKSVPDRLKPGEGSDIVVTLLDNMGNPRSNVVVWVKMDAKTKIEGEVRPESGLTNALGEFRTRFFARSLGKSQSYRESCEIRVLAGSSPSLKASTDVQVRER